MRYPHPATIPSFPSTEKILCLKRFRENTREPLASSECDESASQSSLRPIQPLSPLPIWCRSWISILIPSCNRIRYFAFANRAKTLGPPQRVACCVPLLLLFLHPLETLFAGGDFISSPPAKQRSFPVVCPTESGDCWASCRRVATTLVPRPCSPSRRWMPKNNKSQQRFLPC